LPETGKYFTFYTDGEIQTTKTDEAVKYKKPKLIKKEKPLIESD
jgi:hypothetical protein